MVSSGNPFFLVEYFTDQSAMGSDCRGWTDESADVIPAKIRPMQLLALFLSFLCPAHKQEAEVEGIAERAWYDFSMCHFNGVAICWPHGKERGVSVNLKAFHKD